MSSGGEETGAGVGGSSSNLKQPQQSSTQQHSSTTTMRDEKVKMDASIQEGNEGSGTDVISTIESDLTLLVQIMSASIHYISTKSAHVQMNATIPQYNPVGSGQVHASKFLVDQEIMAESIEELSDDLVGKIKDIEKLVKQLPRQVDDQSFQLELDQLQQQMAGVNEEYRNALNEAGEIYINDCLFMSRPSLILFFYSQSQRRDGYTTTQAVRRLSSHKGEAGHFSKGHHITQSNKLERAANNQLSLLLVSSWPN